MAFISEGAPFSRTSEAAQAPAVPSVAGVADTWRMAVIQ